MTMITPVSVNSSNTYVVQFQKERGTNPENPVFQLWYPHIGTVSLWRPGCPLPFPHLILPHPSVIDSWKVAKTVLFQRAFGLMHHLELDLISLLYTANIYCVIVCFLLFFWFMIFLAYCYFIVYILLCLISLQDLTSKID